MIRFGEMTTKLRTLPLEGSGPAEMWTPSGQQTLQQIPTKRLLNQTLLSNYLEVEVGGNYPHPMPVRMVMRKKKRTDREHWVWHTTHCH